MPITHFGPSFTTLAAGARFLVPLSANPAISGLLWTDMKAEKTLRPGCIRKGPGAVSVHLSELPERIREDSGFSVVTFVITFAIFRGCVLVRRLRRTT